MKTTMHDNLEHNLLSNRRPTPAFFVAKNQPKESQQKPNETEAVVWLMMTVLLALILLFSYWFWVKVSP